MSWRTVLIRDRAKLDYKMNYMTVRKEEETIRININELYMVIIESTAVSITAVLLNELVKNKVQVIFCDEKRNPNANLISIYGSHDTSIKYRMQMNWKAKLVETIWTKIVYEKIKNQMLFLKELGKEEYKMLAGYLEELEFNDATNREGHAAKVYFNSLYGKNFNRNKECFRNSALDYGYAIILSAFNREIVASGYATQLGFCHNNQFNPFNLACDLMEPFRIIVDRVVYKLEGGELDKNHKKELVQILNDYVIIDNKKQTVSTAIKIYTQQIFKALNNNDASLLKMYSYE